MHSVLSHTYPAPTIYTEIEQLVSRRLYEAAENLAFEYLNDDPTSVEMLTQLASIEFNMGDLDGAIEAAEQGLSLDPNNRDLLVLAADVYLGLGLIDRATNAATLALSLSPRDQEVNVVSSRVWTAQALETQDDQKRASSLELAAHYCEIAAELGATGTSFYLEAAVIYLMIQDYSEAEFNLRRILAAEPHHPLATFLTGQMAFRKGEWAKAEAFLSEAATSGSAWSQEAQVLLDKISSKASSVSGRPRNLFYRAAVTVGGALFACVLAFVPTMFAWIAVDSLTGYFPPMWVVGLSLPIGPILVYLANEALSSFSIWRSKKALDSEFVSNRTLSYTRSSHSRQSQFVA